MFGRLGLGLRQAGFLPEFLACKCREQWPSGARHIAPEAKLNLILSFAKRYQPVSTCMEVALQNMRICFLFANDPPASTELKRSDSLSVCFVLFFVFSVHRGRILGACLVLMNHSSRLHGPIHVGPFESAST